MTLDLDRLLAQAAEGDVVPQRAVRTVATAGPHFITLDHSFFSGGEYTYDFFASPDYTLGDNLAACNDVPSTGSFGDFGNSECLALLANKTVLPIPSEASAPTGINTYTYPHVADAQADAAADGTVIPVARDCIVQDKLIDDSLNVKLFLHRQQFSLPPAPGAAQ